MNPVQEFDFIVIGSGLAGLTFALHAAEHGVVAILTKASLFESNTSYAQGGIAAAVGESDSWELHEEDTLIAGAGLCDPAAVRKLVQNAPRAIEYLASIGARFDREDVNLTDWALGREGGHSRNRIVHHADKTGWEIERAMNEAVRKNPNIRIFENTFVTSLAIQDGQCVGASAVVADAGESVFLGRATMLATGGCGRLYAHTTNPIIATADGIGLAHDAGAEISDMEFMQFHPTTLYHPQLRSFLISEAVRGEGGTLRNHRGDRFMYDYDDRLELAPRDIVARAIDAEIRKLETWCVYLDVTHLQRDAIQHHFPMISEKLRSVGIEPHRHWIPIVPAQHYSCGGVVTDLDGRTSVKRLYAAGEVARTGVHGANRLASNSLLEALVFAESASLAAVHEESVALRAAQPMKPKIIPEQDAVRIRHSLRNVMTDYAGIVRRNIGLETGQRRLEELRAEYEAAPSSAFGQYSLETRNLLHAAHYVFEGARKRTANVGLHFNQDLVEAGPRDTSSSAL